MRRTFSSVTDRRTGFRRSSTERTDETVQAVRMNSSLPDELTRVIVRSSWVERESVLVEAREADLLVFRRWEQFIVRRP